jgi:hypothetical protein
LLHPPTLVRALARVAGLERVSGGWRLLLRGRRAHPPGIMLLLLQLAERAHWCRTRARESPSLTQTCTRRPPSLSSTLPLF